MAYNTPPTKANGDVFTGAEFNTYVRDNMAASVPDIFAAKGDLAVATGPDVAVRLAAGSNGQRLTADSAQAAGVKWADDNFAIGALFYNGGAAIVDGSIIDIEVPQAGVLKRVTGLADASGTILISAGKVSYASFPSFAAIDGGLSPGVFGTGNNITGTVTKTAGSNIITGSGTSFTTALAVGDVIDIPGTGNERVMITAIGSNTSLTVHRTMTHSASGQVCTRHAAAQKTQDTTLTGWTLAVAEGDIIRLTALASRTILRATLSLVFRKA